MNQWINQFLENEIVNRTDKPINARPLSVLPVRPLSLLDAKKVENNLETGTDKTDKPINGGPLSVLSVRPPGLLDEKLINTPEPDISDRLDSNLNMSDLSGRTTRLFEENFFPYDEYDLEERLAIAEYDGEQTALHAQRIAYLDAFISFLWNVAEDSPHKDWLSQQIQIALATVERQNLSRLN